MSDNLSFSPLEFRPTCTTPLPTLLTGHRPSGLGGGCQSQFIHQSVKGVSDGELGGPFSPVREGENKVICFWLTKWDMIQKPDMWLTEDRGRMNTTPSMKYLPKYFETNVKGYSLATLMKVFLISEEIMQSRRFYGPMSSVQYCHAYNFHCAKDEAFSQIGFYRAKASVFVCVCVCVWGGG